MGALGGLLGLNGGFNGTGANVTAGSDAQKLADAYGGGQSALRSQGSLLQALQGQGGIGNQSQVYNQLQGVVNGTGPNPAQAMLNQATGTNVANQAALMAGQRGAGANVGLMARQAGQAGAGIQQNAAGQAATMQANQSLGALGQAGNIAGQQVANQIGATGANIQAQQQNENMQQAGINQFNNVQGGLAGKQMEGQQATTGGLLGGAGAALGLAEGGDIPDVQPLAPPSVAPAQSSFGKFFSGMGGAPNGSANPLQQGFAGLGQGIGHSIGNLFKSAPSAPIMGQSAQDYMALGDRNGQSASDYTSLPNQAAMPLTPMTGAMAGMAKGGNVGNKLKSGGKVPGKAQMAGNSPKNDTVKAALSPGEGVIDRETMAHPGPVGDAARFVMAYVNHRKGSK